MLEKNDLHSPPAWARKILKWRCPVDALEEVEGDLLELYEYWVNTVGTREANKRYVMNAIRLQRPLAYRTKQKKDSSLNTPTMIKHYALMTVRNVLRSKSFAFINLTGLTLGMVTSMLIFQYVIFENSADRFHTDSDRIYRVAFKATTSGGTPEVVSQIFLGAGDSFKEELPEVEAFTRIRSDFFQEGPTISHTNNTEKIALKDIRAIMVDSTFLKFFTFPMIRGNKSNALHSTKSILLTASMAQKLFGDADPIGKIIDYSLNQGPQSLEVTGVLQDPPANSHIQFDVAIPLQTYLDNIPEPNRQPWEFRQFTTYVKLRTNADVVKNANLMNAIVDRYLGEDLKRNNTTLAVQLQPMHSVYFDRQTDLGMIGFGSALVSTRTGNERMVYFFTVIAVITLLIALMSYVNLSTVRSLDRAKEVGIRKVMGALKFNLKVQFFLEAVMMNAAALFCAVVIILLLMPIFNNFAQTNFSLASWFNPNFLMLFGAVFVIGVLLSGLYPAFVLSSFMPIAALKGSAGSFTSRSSLRRFLVVFQYAPAIALLVCTVVVYNQLDFMRRMDVGIELDKLVTIRSPRFLPENTQSRDAEAVFKNELKNIASIEGASYAGNQAGRGLNFLIPFSPDTAGLSGVKWFKCSGIDHDFANVFGLKLLAGELFAEGMEPMYGNPDDFVRKVVMNETAVRALGFEKYGDVVGRLLTSDQGSRYYVLGVLEDFNWSSVHQATDPVMLWYTPNNRFMTIRFSSDVDLNDALAQVKSVYDKLFPMDVFHYEFADDVFNKQYGEDERFAKLFGIFSSMAILIASLGLFGLSAFTASRRSKEVGIRKVLGASVGQIVQLLSKDFLVLVFVAFLIASPMAWLVMDAWLKNFAFHISLGALPFIITGISALLIAVVTVSLKSIGIAGTNPVEVLRTE